MKFDKKHRIYAAASDDASRYSIDSILFERDDDGARLVATNGRILAVVPVEDFEADVAGPISQHAIRDACKSRTKARADACVLLPDEQISRTIRKDCFVEHARPDGVRFPDWKACVPKPENSTSITLSARYLADLADALGVLKDDVDGITLTFETKDGQIDQNVPVRVDASSPANDAYGVIMPISGK